MFFVTIFLNIQNAMKYNMILSIKMKGDVISDHFLMLWFQKDSLDTVGFRTYGGGSRVLNLKVTFWVLKKEKVLKIPSFSLSESFKVFNSRSGRSKRGELADWWQQKLDWDKKWSWRPRTGWIPSFIFDPLGRSMIAFIFLLNCDLGFGFGW